MLLKITHPILFNNQVLLPGEITNVPARVAREWLEQQWATKVAEVSNDNG
jgi:hypothetical protein